LAGLRHLLIGALFMCINSRSLYDFGEIDWDEFWRVVKGGGPCHLQRMATRKSAHENGRWVREAAAVYAHKQRTDQQVA
jgi:ring-1,2-phenylacetyl-CoA epoxidase subunit PaaA